MTFSLKTFDAPLSNFRNPSLFVPTSLHQKAEVSHHQLVLSDHTFSRYHLTVHAWSFIPPSCKDKVDLTRLLAATKGH